MYPKTIGNVPAPETRPLARPPKGAPPEGNAKEVTRRRRRVPTAALRDDSVVAHGSFAARQCRSTGCRVCRVNVHTQSQTELGPENCPTAKRGCGKYGRTRALFTRWPLISEASLPATGEGKNLHNLAKHEVSSALDRARPSENACRPASRGHRHRPSECSAAVPTRNSHHRSSRLLGRFGWRMPSICSQPPQRG